MTRDVSIDYLRSGVTMLVVAHHASLAYNTVSVYNPEQYMKSSTPIVDTVRFLPLDLFVGWNDMFFMCLMFFISGLFIVGSLNRKGAGRFMIDRFQRLGIPFIICALVLAPLAYYPSWLESNAAGEGHYLYRFFTADGWTSGPAWFIWVLLVHGAVVAGAYRLFPGFMKRCSWTADSAGQLFVVFLAASLIVTIPLRLWVEPGHWTHVIGPLYFHTWRVLLYFVWFLLGGFLGSADLGRSLSRKNLKLWPMWLFLGGLIYLAHGLIEQNAVDLGNMPRWFDSLVLTTLYCLCCTLTCLGAMGLARAFFHQAHPAADSLSANAYGIYVFHYVFVIWIQYALLSQPLPPIVKFLIVFAGALSASWLVTALLRKTPANQVL